jgi:hypothetical protein
MNYSILTTALISQINVSFPAPLLYPTGESPYGASGISTPRPRTPVDLNSDGWLDLFIQPSYFAYGPSLMPIVLLNNKTGGFYDASATYFKSAPGFQQLNSLFFEDFNGDGKVDLFAIDQGLELRGKDGNSWDGASNRLFLQGEDGALADRTSTLASNAVNFNHVSSMGDVNGDGHADIVLTQLGGSTFAGQGTSFYFGDGKGGFSYSLAGLPEEIKYIAKTERQWNSTSIDYQFSGSNGIGDLNNDGRADLVVGSYTSADLVSGQRTIRTFTQQADGQFVQKFSIGQPAALQSAFGNMGVAAIQVADLDGDGRKDIVALWENGGKTGVQILRNLGDDQFADTTVSWLGSHLPREFKEAGAGYYQNIVAAIELKDFNHDGKIDLVFKQYGLAPAQLVDGTATGSFLYLNDGTGKLSAANPMLNGLE